MTLAARSQRLIAAVATLWAVTTVIGCGCGAAGSAQGKWSRIDPETGIAMGDVLTIEDGTFHMTGLRAITGRVESKDGHVQLIIEKIGDMTREEAIKSATGIEVEKQLKSLDRQLVFDVVAEEGKTRLVQVGKGNEFAEWRFEKQPSP